jgi:hypothetical protein
MEIKCRSPKPSADFRILSRRGPGQELIQGPAPLDETAHKCRGNLEEGEAYIADLQHTVPTITIAKPAQDPTAHFGVGDRIELKCVNDLKTGQIEPMTGEIVKCVIVTREGEASFIVKRGITEGMRKEPARYTPGFVLIAPAEYIDRLTTHVNTPKNWVVNM